MKLVYRGKTTFNLNGTTIYYALAITNVKACVLQSIL
jgi:hypothetical protein